MRLPAVNSAAGLDIALTGIPWDGGTTNRAGARHGPREIRSQSSLMRRVHHVSGTEPFSFARIADVGDVSINPIDLRDALKRIELGTYGKCEMSGKQIPKARLEAIPFARFTVECQSQLEKQNKASRVRQSVTSLFGLTDEEGGETEEEEVTPAEVKE